MNFAHPKIIKLLLKILRQPQLYFLGFGKNLYKVFNNRLEATFISSASLRLKQNAKIYLLLTSLRTQKLCLIKSAKALPLKGQHSKLNQITGLLNLLPGQGTSREISALPKDTLSYRQKPPYPLYFHLSCTFLKSQQSPVNLSFTCKSSQKDYLLTFLSSRGPLNPKLSSKLEKIHRFAYKSPRNESAIIGLNDPCETTKTLKSKPTTLRSTDPSLKSSRIGFAINRTRCLSSFLGCTLNLSTLFGKSPPRLRSLKPLL